MSFDDDRLDADADSRTLDGTLIAAASDDCALAMIQRHAVYPDSSGLEHVTASDGMNEPEVHPGVLLLFIDSDEEGSLRG